MIYYIVEFTLVDSFNPLHRTCDIGYVKFILQLIYRSFATRVSLLKIWHLWVIGNKRNVCRCTFNRYSVV